MTELQHTSEDQLAEIVAKYQAKGQRIKTATYNGHEFIIRSPTVAEAREHAGKLDNPITKIDADEQLLRAILVKVDDQDDPKEARIAFNNLRNKWPYIARSTALGKPMLEFLGLVEEAEGNG